MSTATTTTIHLEWRVQVRLVNGHISHWGTFATSDTAIDYYESLHLAGNCKRLQVRVQGIRGRAFQTLLDEQM